MYQVLYSPQSEKFIVKQDRKTQLKIVSKLEHLATNPHAPNPNVTKMQGLANGYRLRIGDIRCIYKLDAEHQKIVVWKINFRGEIYKP
ncbi:MAG: type II toxin-antitoxin system RelE/ParE family toxin [Patescibacteria group bacterium]